MTEFRYSAEIGKAFRGNNQLKWLGNFGTAWGFLESTHALTFVDNHDNQRGHGGGGAEVLNYKLSKQYKMATAFHLAWPFGISRVMSSFDFKIENQGPPMDENSNIIPASFNADDSCGNGWICEHRWRQVYNMIGFKISAGNTTMANWWDNGNNQIAFGRGNRAFIVFNGESGNLNQNLATELPAGIYCDVISGSRIKNSCSGIIINVGSDGRATFNIAGNAADGVIAVHDGARLK